MSEILVHGTAVTVGETGLIFIGPSGSGKSSHALQMLFSARLAGFSARLVSDDQVFLRAVNGAVTARAPASIAGMIELRGSGIGRVEHVPEAVLHHAVALVDVDASNRIPEPNQCWEPGEGIGLPLVFLDRLVRDPFPWLEALIEGFPGR